MDLALQENRHNRSMINLDGILTEKFRPKTLDELICDDKTRKLVTQYKKKGEIPNLLLSGPAGTGKTSLAKVIVNDILGCQYLYINASDENGIDTIRNKVTNFAQVKSIDGKVKVIILDEADFITSGGQSALRATMEQFAEYTRFILTCNYKHKIIQPLQSRCQLIVPKLDIQHVVKRCLQIIKQEGIAVPEDQKKPLLELIKQYFPDVRKTINEIQRNVIDGAIQIQSNQVDRELFDKVTDLLKAKKAVACRKYLIDNEGVFQGDHQQFLKQYLNYIYDVTMDDGTKKAMIATIAEFLYRSSFILDQEIGVFHCLIQLEQLL
jgi:replication factor C small subunit